MAARGYATYGGYGATPGAVQYPGYATYGGYRAPAARPGAAGVAAGYGGYGPHGAGVAAGPHSYATQGTTSAQHGGYYGAQHAAHHAAQAHVAGHAGYGTGAVGTATANPYAQHQRVTATPQPGSYASQRATAQHGVVQPQPGSYAATHGRPTFMTDQTAHGRPTYGAYYGAHVPNYYGSTVAHPVTSAAHHLEKSEATGMMAGGGGAGFYDEHAVGRSAYMWNNSQLTRATTAPGRRPGFDEERHLAKANHKVIVPELFDGKLGLSLRSLVVEGFDKNRVEQAEEIGWMKGDQIVGISGANMGTVCVPTFDIFNREMARIKEKKAFPITFDVHRPSLVKDKRVKIPVTASANAIVSGGEYVVTDPTGVWHYEDEECEEVSETQTMGHLCKFKVTAVRTNSFGEMTYQTEEGQWLVEPIDKIAAIEPEQMPACEGTGDMTRLLNNLQRLRQWRDNNKTVGNQTKETEEQGHGHDSGGHRSTSSGGGSDPGANSPPGAQFAADPGAQFAAEFDAAQKPILVQ